MEGATKMEIQIPYPDAGELHLRITVGACRLRITAGDGPNWVSGTYDDPTGAMPARIEVEAGTARIAQVYNWPETWNAVNRPPSFDLTIGRGRPFALTLETGANEGSIDLGGLPISRMAIKHGAGRQVIDFAAPNPQPMDRLTVGTGAASLELRHLANANCAEMSIEGGAAAYVFDFGGALQRSGEVRITTGMSAVEILVPATSAAKIATESVMGSVDVGNGFMKKEGAFWNEAALAGKAPVLTVRASVAMGAIRLRNV